MDDFKRSARKHIGVGGYHCSCCNDFLKNKEKLRRYSRRVLKQKDKSTLWDESSEAEWDYFGDGEEYSDDYWNWDYYLSKDALLEFISMYVNSNNLWEARYYLDVLEVLFGSNDLDFLCWNSYLSIME